MIVEPRILPRAESRVITDPLILPRAESKNSGPSYPAQD